jgi:hypothetical protein
MLSLKNTRRKAWTIERYMTENMSNDSSKFIRIKQQCMYGMAFQIRIPTTNDITFRHIGFNDKHSLDQYLHALNSGKYRHGYELLLNPIRKLYLDLDFKKRKGIVYSTTDDIDIDVDNCLTNDEMDTYIDGLIKLINNILNTNITTDDVIVATRTKYITSSCGMESVNKHISIHMIFPTIIMEHTEQKKLMKILQMVVYDDVKWNKFIDTAVYGKTQLFGLIFCKKITHDTDVFIPYKYKQTAPFSDNHIITDDMLISVLPTEYTLSKIVNDPTTSNLVESVCKPKHQPRIRHDKNKTIYLNKHTIVDDILNVVSELPTEFFENTSDWIGILHILKFYNITDDQLRAFNELSIDKSTIIYTLENNIRVFNSIEVSPKYQLGTLYIIINKYLPYHFVLCENEKYIDFISSILKITDDDILTEILLCLQSNQEFMVNNITYYFCGKTKNIYKIVDGEKSMVSNYIIDYEYVQTMSTRLDMYTPIVLDNIQNTRPYLDHFLKNEKQALFIKATYGSGKTHHCIKYVIDYITQHQPERRIIMITHRNSLGLQLEEQFKSYGFVSHIEARKNKQNINNYKNIICSVDTSYKIISKPTDVIVLDEFVSIMGYLGTIINQKRDNSKQQQKLLKTMDNIFHIFLNSSKVLCLDADMSYDRIKMFSSVADNQYTNTIIHTLDNNFSDYKINVVIDADIFEDHVKSALFQNKKVVVASTTQKTIDRTDGLFNTLCNIFQNKTIMLIDGKPTCVVFKNNVRTDLSKSDTLSALENTIITQYEVDCLLYSPTITTGVSINQEYFHECISYCSNNSVVSRAFLQMLFRTRRLIDKKITIHCGVPSKKVLPPKTTIEFQSKYNEAVLTSLNRFLPSTQPVLFKEHLDNITAQNQVEKDNSRLFFIEEVIYILRSYGMNVNVSNNILLSDIPSNMGQPVSTRQSINLITPRVYKYISNHPFYKTLMKSHQEIKSLNIICNTQSELLYKLLFWNDIDNGGGFLYKHINNIDIPMLNQQNEELSETERKYFTYDNNLFYEETESQLVNYTEHIQSHYLTHDLEKLVGTNPWNITIKTFHSILSIYNNLKMNYVGNDFQTILINNSEYYSLNPVASHPQSIKDKVVELEAIKFIISTLGLKLDTDLPYELSREQLYKIFETFKSTTSYSNIMLCLQFVWDGDYDKQILVFLNKMLSCLGIHIFVYKKDTNAGKYNNTIYMIDYKYFTCQPIQTHSNHYYKMKAPVRMLNINNSNIIYDQIVSNCTQINSSDISPHTRIRLTHDNPNIVSSRGNIYKYVANNVELDVYKINNGKKYEPYDDNCLESTCDRLNETINNSLMWLVNNDTIAKLDVDKQRTTIEGIPYPYCVIFKMDIRSKSDKDIVYYPYQTHRTQVKQQTYYKQKIIPFEYYKTKRDKVLTKIDNHHYFYSKMLDKKIVNLKTKNGSTKLPRDVIWTYFNNVIKQLNYKFSKMFKPMVCNKSYYDANYMAYELY